MQEVLENIIKGESLKEDGLYECLEMAKGFKKTGNMQKRYEIFKDIYNRRLFEYNKALDGSYEEYIIEKVDFLVELATLNLMFTKDVVQSIGYIDEALDLLDTHESVRPYVDIKNMRKKKAIYMQILFENI